MQQPPFILNTENNSCYIYPRPTIPEGRYLTYESCPERFNNFTPKLVRYCCFRIIYDLVQSSNYKKAQDWLRDYSSSLLVIPAVLFNVLSLVVLNRISRIRNNQQTSTTFYMKSLCVFDALTIISKFLHEIVVVRNGNRTNPIVITSFMCKFLNFFESACAISSIYLLIAMSIDKLICVLLPLKVGQLLTPTKAKIVFSYIILLSALFSSYELFSQHVVELPISTVNDVKSSNNNKKNNNHILNRTSLSKYENETLVTSDKTQIVAESTSTSSFSDQNYTLFRYDCDSKWPERLNDWVLINNIVKVFLPILIICICNSWIAIALARAKRSTEALFRDSSRSNYSSNNNNNNGNNDSTSTKYNMGLLSSNGNSKRMSKDCVKSANNKTKKKKKGSAEFYIQDDNDESNLDSKSSNLHLSSNVNISRKFSSETRTVVHIRGRNSTQHISIMLFAVSLGFVALNLPYAMKTLFHRHFFKQYNILDYLYHSENLFFLEYSKTEIQNSLKYEFFSYFTHTLLDLNYIANFFLYFFSGSRFRSQLIALIKCKSVQDSKTITTLYHSNIHRVETNQTNGLNSVNNTCARQNKLSNTYNPFILIRNQFLKRKDKQNFPFDGRKNSSVRRRRSSAFN